MSAMDNPTITFIGGGNMAQALIGGLRSAGTAPNSLRVADPSASQREQVASQFGVQTFENNAEAVRGSDAVVLAVKPQAMDEVLTSLSGRLDTGTLVVSVAAGVTLEKLRGGLDGHRRVVRVMPNTPALYGAGIAGMVAAEGVDDTDRQLAGELLAAAGQVVWVDDESLMDVVTAVSGSGPAYFFRLTELLAAAGERAGLPAEVAARLARQTAVGAGTMLEHAEVDAGELRRRVTSPGGTTEAALETLAAGGFDQLIDEAVAAAVKRGRELGGE